MNVTRLIVAAVFLLAANAADARWVVQIGAFSDEPSAQFLDEASQLGETRIESRPQRGDVAVVVGPWMDITEARAALPNILAKYPDAFIRRQTASDTIPTSVQIPDQSVASSTSRQLSLEEQRNVVLLDGKPHYKLGDTFTPIDEYLRRKNP